MGGIPIASDIWETILAFIGWIFQSMPSPFNWIFFILLISIFLSFISLFLDFMHIPPPRFGYPPECQTLKEENIGLFKSTISGNLSNLTASQCSDFVNCVNDYADQYNFSCEKCGCYASLFDPLNPTIPSCGIFGIYSISYPNTCTMKEVYEPVFSTNITLYEKCLYELKNVTPYLSALQEKCKNLGINVFDLRLIWGSAILVSLFLFFLKMYAVFGIRY